MTSIVALSGIVHYYTQLYYFKAEQEQKKRENLAVKVTYLIFGCLAGLVHRQRGRSRVQAPSPATDPQMDSDSLLTLQSPLGLGHPFLGHLLFYQLVLLTLGAGLVVPLCCRLAIRAVNKPSRNFSVHRGPYPC